HHAHFVPRKIRESLPRRYAVAAVRNSLIGPTGQTLTDTASKTACYSREMFRRVIWIVLDSVGIGEMPDAAAYGDAGSDTLGNLARQRAMHLPHMAALGLGNIKPLAGIPAAASPAGAFGRCALASPGKDTTTGHWEMAGIH